MTRLLKQFILTAMLALFASQASALFVQADTFNPLVQGVGTNRYAYSGNDPINRADPNGHFSYNVHDAEYLIDEGDTFESISDLTGVSVERLQELNGSGLDVGGSFVLPRTDNIRAFEWAAGQIGTTDYSYGVAVGQFPANSHKCNAFCGDAYMIGSETNYPTRQRKGWRAFFFGADAGTAVTAGVLATGNLPGTILVPLEQAILGDTVAWPRAFNDATGHSGIFTGGINIRANVSFPEVSSGRPMIMDRQNGDFGFISAGYGVVSYATGLYMANHPLNYGLPGFRRIGQ